MSARAFLRACFGYSRKMHDNAVGVLTESAQSYERVILRLKVLKRRVGELVAGKTVAAIHAGRDVVVEKSQMAGIAHRQRLEHHCIDQREDSGIRANTERQRKHGNRCQNRSFAELANAVAQVVPDGLKPADGAGALHTILDQHGVAGRTTSKSTLKQNYFFSVTSGGGGRFRSFIHSMLMFWFALV